MPKQVSNTKQWCNLGWRYYMMRTVNGKQYAIALVISPYEMHARTLVALRVRNSRRELREFCEEKKKLPQFT